MSESRASRARAAYERKVDQVISHLDIEKYGEDWNKRFNALTELQELVIKYASPLHGDEERLQEVFSADSFRNLCGPLENQLKDLRSSIVREACKVVSTFAEHTGDVAQPLAKILLPTLLEMSASGNKVMTAYAEDCIRLTLKHVHVVRVVKRIANLIKRNKSKGVREGCMLSVLVILDSWSKARLEKVKDAVEESIMLGIKDASQEARKSARYALALFHGMWPRLGQEMIARCERRTQKAVKDLVEKRKREGAAFMSPGTSNSVSGADGGHAGQLGQSRHGRPSNSNSRLSGGSTKSSSSSSSFVDAAATPVSTTASSPAGAASPVARSAAAVVANGVSSAGSSAGVVRSSSSTTSTTTSSSSSSSRGPGDRSSTASAIASHADAQPSVGNRAIVKLRGKEALGTVRFIGETSFRAGIWVGVELDDGTDEDGVKVGKNDGSVRGTHYFRCDPGLGVFVRPSAIEVIGRGDAADDEEFEDDEDVDDEDDTKEISMGEDAKESMLATAAANAERFVDVDALGEGEGEGEAEEEMGGGGDAGEKGEAQEAPVDPAEQAVRDAMAVMQEEGIAAGAAGATAAAARVMAAHRAHVDALLSALREEMTMLAMLEARQEKHRRFAASQKRRVGGGAQAARQGSSARTTPRESRLRAPRVSTGSPAIGSGRRGGGGAAADAPTAAEIRDESEEYLRKLDERVAAREEKLGEIRAEVAAAVRLVSMPEENEEEAGAGGGEGEGRGQA